MFMLLYSILGLIFLGLFWACRRSWKNYGSFFAQGWHNIGVDHTCPKCNGMGYVPGERRPGELAQCVNCYEGMLPPDPNRFTRIPLALPGRRKWG